MNGQFLLFQSLCVVLVASSAFGGPLLKSVTSQYAYCFELKQFSSDAPRLAPQGPFVIDNVCMDLSGFTYHFLSSEQGGATSFITAPVSAMTVILLDYNLINIKLRLPSQPVAGLRCQFYEPSHVSHVYNIIYEFKSLTRHNVAIGRIQKLILDPDTIDQIIFHSVLSEQAALYIEYYNSTQIILTFKEENAKGTVEDPVLILMAYRFHISDVLVNNNVVLRFKGESVLFMVLTFCSEWDAANFCNSFHGYFNPNVVVTIPPALQAVLETTKL